MKSNLTPAQRASFFGNWWPACCEAQGWDVKNEDVRRAHIHEATKGATDRLSLCTQAQLTAVFQLTWFKTNPDNLNTALPVANPVEAREEDEQRRAVVALSQKATAPVIAQVLAPLCRKHHVGDWQRLPSRVLKSVMHWKQFQPGASASGLTHSDSPRIYQMRPAKKFTPKSQPARA